MPENAWDAPSPCTDWTARDIVAHVFNTHARVLATLNGSDPELLSSEDDLVVAWTRATRAVREALGACCVPDTLIHTWDLARATGQDEALDPDAVAQAIESLFPIDDVIRRPGGFGPKIDPPPDADDQTRLLNFAGRSV